MISKRIFSNSLAFQQIVLNVPNIVLPILKYFDRIGLRHLLVDSPEVKLFELQFLGILGIWIGKRLRILLLPEHENCGISETVWIKTVADGLVLPTLTVAERRLGSGHDDLLRLRRRLARFRDILTIDETVDDQRLL